MSIRWKFIANGTVKPIPVEKIGLYVDEYRKRLPADNEVERFSLHSREAGLGYDILDR